MKDLSAIAFIALWMIPGALAGYVVARIAKLDAKLGAAIGALVGFAAGLAMIVQALRSP
jgi:hypothetical protein